MHQTWRKDTITNMKARSTHGWVVFGVVWSGIPFIALTCLSLSSFRIHHQCSLWPYIRFLTRRPQSCRSDWTHSCNQHQTSPSNERQRAVSPKVWLVECCSQERLGHRDEPQGMTDTTHHATSDEWQRKEPRLMHVSGVCYWPLYFVISFLFLICRGHWRYSYSQVMEDAKRRENPLGNKVIWESREMSWVVFMKLELYSLSDSPVCYSLVFVCFSFLFSLNHKHK